MINESLFQVPTSVDDPDVLKRFLDRLVERLDIVLGYRGDNPYAATSDLTTAVAALTQEAEQITTQLVEGTATINQQLLTLVAQLEEQLEEQLQQLANLLARVETLEAEVSDILLELASLNTRLSSLEVIVGALTAYSATALRDFNSTAWQTAPIYTTFTDLGSAIINPPVSSSVDDIDLDDTYGIVTDIIETSVSLNPAAVYTCYVEVRAAYVQKVIIVGAGFAISKVRAGSTWAELIANAWV